MVATGEKAPLLGGGDSQNYYFLNPGGSHSQDGGEGEAVEVLPEGATAEEFAPRVLGTPIFQVRFFQAQERRRVRTKSDLEALLWLRF